MRILLIGQKAFGAEVLTALTKEPVELVGAVVGTGKPDLTDQVETAALEHGIDYIKVSSLKTPQVMEWVSQRKPDLIVMAFVTLYIPMPLVELAPQGAINFHPSLLPLHRGINALPWTILSGDKTAGLSVYFVDDGIDTGDVIVQKSVEIEEKDDFKSLYFEKIFPLGVQAVCEAVALIASGDPPRKKQDDNRASYEPPLKREHLLIRWSEGVRAARNKIRAGNPGIGGVSMLGGKEVRIYGARISGLPVQKDAAPGTVLSVEGGVHVQARDGVLELTTLAVAGERKVPAADFVCANGVSAGARFTDLPS